MSFATSFAFAVSLALSGASAPLAAPVSVMPASQSAQQFVESYFADIPIMIDVARCESHFRQYGKDGSVFRGVVNDRDVGIMQVNEYYHSEAADKLGIDIYTIQGNVAYARYLYEKEGTQPWVSSQPCWGKSKNNTVAKNTANLVATIQK